jgi:hypothetical protein
MSLAQRAFTRCRSARGLRRRPSPPSCADGLRWGDLGASDCPPDYFRITTEEMCRVATTNAFKLWGGTKYFDTYPIGCYFDNNADEIMYLNANTVGAGNPSAQLLCSGAPAFPHRRPAYEYGRQQKRPRLLQRPSHRPACSLRTQAITGLVPRQRRASRRTVRT